MSRKVKDEGGGAGGEGGGESGAADDKLGEILVNSQMVLFHGQQQLIEYLATKIIFFDLRDQFVARLYYPTPTASPLAALLHEGSAFDLCLAEVARELSSWDAVVTVTEPTDADWLLWALMERVCQAIVEAVEWCLVGEPMGQIERQICCEDAQLVVEDLMVLRRYFVQRDDEGNVNGLEEERVAAKTGRLEMLANNLLAESTERLIELYYDRTTPEHSDKALIDRQTIIGALSNRRDKAATDLIRDLRKKKG